MSCSIRTVSLPPQGANILSACGCHGQENTVQVSSLRRGVCPKFQIEAFNKIFTSVRDTYAIKRTYGVVASISGLHVGGIRFKSRPGDRLYCLRFLETGYTVWDFLRLVIPSEIFGDRLYGLRLFQDWLYCLRFLETSYAVWGFWRPAVRSEVCGDRLYCLRFLETDYIDWGSSWFSHALPEKGRHSTLN
jgi:hypothetical protein